MDEREQSQNPMSFLSEMFGKMMGVEGDHPGKAMMERAQEAAGQAQQAQAAMMESMREAFSGMSESPMWRAGGKTDSDSSSGAGSGSSSANPMDDMQRMMGQMSAPWAAFLQLDRGSRLKMLEQHRGAVVSYLDMLDGAIETLKTDLEAQADDDA